MKTEYLKTVFEASKSEIEEILNQAFQPNRCWMMLTVDEQVIQVPSYLLAQLTDFIQEGEAVKTTSTKINLKNDLESYYDGCEQMFLATGNVFRDYLQSAYNNILKSDDSLYNKIKRLDSLKSEASRYSNLFGKFNEYLWQNTEGLIYGEPIDEILSHAGEPVSNSLKRLHPASTYSSKQWTMKLEKLSDIQKTALPKAKEYISLQISDEPGELSPIEKVQLVEEKRKQPGINSYKKAIDQLNKEKEKIIFANYNSFKTVRNRFKDSL